MRAPPRSGRPGDARSRHSDATADTQVAVGGPAGNLGDLTSVTRLRLWLDVAALSLVVALVLALALRALLLPLVATSPACSYTAATFGVLALLFGGSAAPLGGTRLSGPDHDHQRVHARLRDHDGLLHAALDARARGIPGQPGAKQAVRIGLRETAAASTGAGLAMVAALIPFSTTEFLNVRALGIGVAIAILIDVLIVRPVLLPAAAAVLGRFGWWPTRHTAASAASDRS